MLPPSLHCYLLRWPLLSLELTLNSSSTRPYMSWPWDLLLTPFLSPCSSLPGLLQVPPTHGFHDLCLCCFPTESCSVLLPHLQLAPFHAPGLTSAPEPGLSCSYCLQSPCSPGTLSHISFIAPIDTGHIFFLICVYFPPPPLLPLPLHPPLYPSPATHTHIYPVMESP